MELNMKSLSARTIANPAFKMAQPLPALPGHPTAADGNWLQLGCAGWMNLRAAARPVSDSKPGLCGTAILHAAAQSGNIPRMAPAWAGRNF